MIPTLEEVMEEVQQQMVDEEEAQAERARMYKLQMFLIGDFYEMIAAEKVANLEALHNA